MTINLTPFGFTSTESLVYSALLDRGFTSAYALAQAIGVARANTYQALHGLVAKGAAVLVGDRPQVFRPVGPSELLAMLSQRQASRLDELESQINRHGRAGQEITVRFSGRREFNELVLRTAARAKVVSCAAEPNVLASLNPVWRKRAQDRSETRLWAIGEQRPHLPIPLTGTVGMNRVAYYFGSPATILLADNRSIVGTETAEAELRGLWTSDPALCGCMAAALDALTSS